MLYPTTRVTSTGYRFRGSIGAMKLAASGVNCLWRTATLDQRRSRLRGSTWPRGLLRSPRGTEESPRRWPWGTRARRSPGGSASAAAELANCANGSVGSGRSIREKLKWQAARPERCTLCGRASFHPVPQTGAGWKGRFAYLEFCQRFFSDFRLADPKFQLFQPVCPGWYHSWNVSMAIISQSQALVVSQ